MTEPIRNISKELEEARESILKPLGCGEKVEGDNVLGLFVTTDFAELDDVADDIFFGSVIGIEELGYQPIQSFKDSVFRIVNPYNVNAYPPVNAAIQQIVDQDKLYILSKIAGRIMDTKNPVSTKKAFKIACVIIVMYRSVGKLQDLIDLE